MTREHELALYEKIDTLTKEIEDLREHLQLCLNNPTVVLCNCQEQQKDWTTKGNLPC